MKRSPLFMELVDRSDVLENCRLVLTFGVQTFSSGTRTPSSDEVGSKEGQHIAGNTGFHFDLGRTGVPVNGRMPTSSATTVGYCFTGLEEPNMGSICCPG